LFSVETCENCVVSCFKWFSNVFERLKPNSRDFSTNSLSIYNTRLCLLLIALAPERMRGEDLCYKFGAFVNWGKVLSNHHQPIERMVE